MANNELNVLKVLEYRLKNKMKEAIYEKPLNDLMDEFKKEIEPKVRGAVECITMEGVHNFKNLMKMRDEIHVYIKFNDDEINQVISDA